MENSFLVILAVVLCLGEYKIADATSYYLVNAKAEKYLCEKYDLDKSNLECVKYSPKHYFYDIDYWSSGWTTPTWFYKYNGRDFIVKKINNEYRDDYQFNDFCIWCVDFLNQQTEYKIVSVDLTSKRLFEFDKVLAEEDFKNIFYSMDGYTIYAEVSNIEENETEIGEAIKKNSETELKCNNIDVFLVDKSVTFENEITYYNGDRIYFSEHSSTESIQDLQEENKLVMVQ